MAGLFLARSTQYRQHSSRVAAGRRPTYPRLEELEHRELPSSLHGLQLIAFLPVIDPKPNLQAHLQNKSPTQALFAESTTPAAHSTSGLSPHAAQPHLQVLIAALHTL
jgi:hypothetical protein